MQPKYLPEERSDFFSDQRTMRAPPEHTLSTRIASDVTSPHEQRTVTLDGLQNGQTHYNVYCSPCHDQRGFGEGIIVSRGFEKPPSFMSNQNRGLPLRKIFEITRAGKNSMPGFAHRMTENDLWDIATYIKTLQLSQDFPSAQLSQSDRTQLGSKSNDGGYQ